MIRDVWLKCPHCAHVWRQAQIDPDAWWGNVTPEQLAKQPCCPQCEGKPPMEIVRANG